MPGFDRSRIVGESEEAIDEFICGICLEVFIKPTVTQCCGQTFCFDCINEWLQKNNTCPNDRKILTTEQLKSSPKMVTNLLGNMKIKCDFYETGCRVVVKINDLERHKLSECDFNTLRNCDNCGQKKLNHSDKDCIKFLLVKLNNLQSDFDQFRKQKVEMDSYINVILLKNQKLQIEFDRNERLIDELKKIIIESKARIRSLESSHDNLPAEKYISKEDIEMKSHLKKSVDSIAGNSVGPTTVKQNINKKPSVKGKASFLRTRFENLVNNDLLEAKRRAEEEKFKRLEREKHEIERDKKAEDERQQKLKGVNKNTQNINEEIISENNESIFDTIEDKGLTATALYAYQERNFDEISFEPGDTISNIEFMGVGWWRGRCRGKVGHFPPGYVDLND